jgi:hypothetical protein
MPKPAATLALVRPQVRDLLARSPAYTQLPPAAQRQIAAGTVRIGAYLAEPESLLANQLPGALAAIPARPSSQDFLAEINFPDFVSSLIHGVFQAIVTASIDQMNAYAELVKSVSKTLDQFANDSLSDDFSREWLAATYPDCFERVPRSHRLRLRPGCNSQQALPSLNLLPLDNVLDALTAEDIEKKLVPAARRRLAATRQQLLATMVLMGINRIVVTSGTIQPT